MATRDPAREIDCMCGVPLSQYVAMPTRLPSLQPSSTLTALRTHRLIKHHGTSLLREEGEQGVTYAPIMKDDGDEERGRTSRRL